MRRCSDKHCDTKNPTSSIDVLRAAAHRREVLHDEADELDRPGARRVIGGRTTPWPAKTPVRSPSAIIARRLRPAPLRALTHPHARDAREAAAWAFS